MLIYPENTWGESHDHQKDGICSLFQISHKIKHIDERYLFVRKMVFLGNLRHGKFEKDSLREIGTVEFIIGTKAENKLSLLCTQQSVGTGSTEDFLKDEFAYFSGAESGMDPFFGAPDTQIRKVEYLDLSTEVEQYPSRDWLKELILQRVRIQGYFNELFKEKIWDGLLTEREITLMAKRTLDRKAELFEKPQYFYNPSYWNELTEKDQWRGHYLRGNQPARVTQGVTKIDWTVYQ